MTLIQASERYNVQLPKEKIKTRYKKTDLKLPFITKQRYFAHQKMTNVKGFVFTIAKLFVLD